MDFHFQPIKVVDGVKVSKLQGVCLGKDFEMANLNSKAITYIICAIDRVEYHCIMNLMTAKEIWDTLEETNEGTNEV